MVTDLTKNNDILSVNTVDRDGKQLITRAKYDLGITLANKQSDFCETRDPGQQG